MQCWCYNLHTEKILYSMKNAIKQDPKHVLFSETDKKNQLYVCK